MRVLDGGGQCFGFQVTNKTQVELGDKQMAANELGNEDHQQATIRFVPTSRGNLAKNIRISAS